MQGLRNSDNAKGVKEWWLVTPFMADMLKNNGCCIRLLLVGQTDFGSRSLNGLGDSEDSGGDVGMTRFLMAI